MRSIYRAQQVIHIFITRGILDRPESGMHGRIGIDMYEYMDREW